MVVVVRAFVVLCERTASVYTCHCLFVVVSLLFGQRKHVDIASNYATYFPSFVHNVVVKCGHGIRIAIDEQRCLMFCMLVTRYVQKPDTTCSSMMVSPLLSSVSARSIGVRNDLKSTTM